MFPGSRVGTEASSAQEEPAPRKMEEAPGSPSAARFRIEGFQGFLFRSLRFRVQGLGFKGLGVWG